MTPQGAESEHGQRVRRVLYNGDPKGDDFRAAHAEVRAIRSEISRLRGRLQAVGSIETHFWFDSTANVAAGTLSAAVIALYRLVDGEGHDLAARAERLDDLWADVDAHPENYLIKEGRSK